MAWIRARAIVKADQRVHEAPATRFTIHRYRRQAAPQSCGLHDVSVVVGPSGGLGPCKSVHDGLDAQGGYVIFGVHWGFRKRHGVVASPDTTKYGDQKLSQLFATPLTARGSISIRVEPARSWRGEPVPHGLRGQAQAPSRATWELRRLAAPFGFGFSVLARAPAQFAIGT